MILFAIALWMKVTATVSLGIAGIIVTVGLALFGSGSDANTAETSRDWIPSAIIFLVAIGLVWWLGK